MAPSSKDDMLNDFDLEKLNTIMEGLKTEIKDGGKDEDVDLEASIKEISLMAFGMNGLIEELRSMIPQEEMSKVGIDDGINEMNMLMEEMSKETEKLKELIKGM